MYPGHEITVTLAREGDAVSRTVELDETEHQDVSVSMSRLWDEFCADTTLWPSTQSVRTVTAADVAAIVGDDGTGDLGGITAQALKDDPSATAEDIAEIVREARADAKLERAAEGKAEVA